MTLYLPIVRKKTDQGVSLFGQVIMRDPDQVIPVYNYVRNVSPPLCTVTPIRTALYYSIGSNFIIDVVTSHSRSG